MIVDSSQIRVDLNIRIIVLFLDELQTYGLYYLRRWNIDQRHPKDRRRLKTT